MKICTSKFSMYMIQDYNKSWIIFNFLQIHYWDSSPEFAVGRTNEAPEDWLAAKARLTILPP